MGKKLAIVVVSLAVLVLASLFLYSRYIGFEAPSLADRFPDDTLALLEIRHVRKATFAFATDDQLQSTASVFQAIAKTLSDAAEEEAFPETDVEIDAALFEDLGTHFKTRVALGCFAPESDQSIPKLLLAARFYGSEESLNGTLSEIASQASTPEESYAIVSELWNGISVSKARISGAQAPPLQPCWAVYDGVFYFSSHLESLQRALGHATADTIATSVGHRLSQHRISDYVDKPDLTLFINGKTGQQYVADVMRNRLYKQGGLWMSFSPDVFLEQIGLKNIDSICTALELTDDRKSYSSVRYDRQSDLPDLLVTADLPLHQEPADMLTYASETLNVQPSVAFLAIKDAALKAAPLANFPYIAVRSRILNRTKLDFEKVLAQAFAPQVIHLQTLDTGTVKNLRGKVVESVIHDQAFKLRLNPDQKLTELWNSQKQALITAASLSTHSEGTTLYIDTEEDATLTGNRIAIDIDEEYVTLGFGTLKSFHTLRAREELYLASDPSTNPFGAEVLQVGSGILSMQGLPEALFDLATVFYLQLNPTKPVPVEFYDFDWSALTVLEQRRESRTFTDHAGHLFRVSEQVE